MCVCVCVCSVVCVCAVCGWVKRTALFSMSLSVTANIPVLGRSTTGVCDVVLL